MIKKTVEWTDFEGVQKKEDFYFHLDKAELSVIELSIPGGVEARVQKITKDNNGAEIMSLFEMLIKKSYGVKIPGGFFVKKQEELDRFLYSGAYAAMFYDIVTHPDTATEFFNGLVPKEE